MNWIGAKSIFQSFKISFGAYKARIFLLTILAFASGLLDVLGLGAFVSVLSLALKQQEVTPDYISQFLAEIFSFLNLDLRISYLLTIISLLFVLKAVVVFVFGFITTRISNDYERDKRNYFYSQTLKADWPYLLKHKIGHLENFIMLQIKFASRFLVVASGVILNVCSFLVYIVMAFNLNAVVTIVALLMGLFILLASKFFVKRTQAYAKEQFGLWHGIAHEINENIVGLKTIKALRVESALISEAKKLFDRLRISQIKTHIIKTLNSAPIQPMSMIFASVMFAISYKQAGFNMGVFAVILYLINRIFVYIEKLQDSMHTVSSLSQSIIKLSDFERDALLNQEVVRGTANFVFKDSLSFKDVAFSYPGGKEALRGINFNIKKGEVVAVVGPSGAGKTTLVDLLLRLFRPTNGKIFLDKAPIENISLDDWRRRVGYVSQDVFLKNLSIEDNIKFFNNAINQDGIFRAAKLANVHDFATALPQGYKTLVGERGIMLSGGQRQRIALARVLAREPEILVLDEATSALDAATESVIKETIANLKGKMTIILIAHKPQLIEGADKVVVLKDGCISSVGGNINEVYA